MRRAIRGMFAITLTAVFIAGAVAAYTDAYAACRLMPQCWTNADCDAICGAGQGRCIHAKCPIRVCRCS